ncbi:Mitochondrial nuclease [Cyphellophora attinorum]|uniref:Endonuclease n=1 Tax=Cyphellophora attinorum TaxID=1664694 RepID=A0A0N1H387_9EURO|nr:Mitochondrial nuclease [Phialophora attinorum]KPI39393.1 Mitochondrial nuclease [Phialophora attinorum]
MSKSTLAIVAAASAVAGGSLTALIFSGRKNVPPPTPVQQPPPTKTTPPIQVAPPPPVTSLPPVPPPVASLSPVDPRGILQYGFPGPVSDALSTPSHFASFNRFTRNPHWVAEHFTPQSLILKNADRAHSVFFEDPAIPPLFRAKLVDYARSGYDRGHQVPAADAKWSQEAMNATFSLTNMCPQVGDGFNRDYWAHFEEFCRNLARRYPSVRVVTGPLYLPKREADGKWRVSYEVIGHPPNVAVPTHFYKVILAEETPSSPIGRVALGAFVLPNAPIPNQKSLTEFEVPIEAVERASGLTFADRLPVERRKRLCQEVQCEILVREFDRTRQQGTLVNAGSATAGQVVEQRRKW